MCEEFGYDRIRCTVTRIWIAVIAIDVIGLSYRPDPIVMLSMGTSIVVPIAYSYGMRLKARRYLALLALTCVFTIPFLTGWSAGRALGGDQLHGSDIAPVIIMMVLFIAGLGGIKDITDVIGDERVGYRSLWVALVIARRTTLLIAVAAAPYVAIIIAVAGGWLPSRFLFVVPWVLIGVPLALLSAVSDHGQRLMVRELFYHFWFALSSTTLFLFYPRGVTLACLVAIAMYWTYASQMLHWSDGLKLSTLSTAGRLLEATVKGRHG